MSEEIREYYLAETEEDKQLLKLFRIQLNHSTIQEPILLYIGGIMGFLTEEEQCIATIDCLLERDYSKMTKEALNQHILEMSLGISELW